MYKENPKEIDENLQPYFMPEGEEGPYASLMVDLVFKKVFDPTVPRSKKNLISLLNDLLEPQLQSLIVDLFLNKENVNRSGSHATRTSSFDLHCKDSNGRVFEVEVQISPMKNYIKRVVFYSCQIIADQAVPGDSWNYDHKPVYILSFSLQNLFKDDRPIHHGQILDTESHKPISDLVNLTFVELKKVKASLSKNAPEYNKWIFAFSYLNRLRKLPPEFDENKFKDLLNIAEVSKFDKQEYLEYEKNMRLEWDEYAEKLGFFEKYKEDIQALEEKAAAAAAADAAEKAALEKSLEMAKAMLDKGLSVSMVSEITKLPVEELESLK